jgi:hypothetical protein
MDPTKPQLKTFLSHKYKSAAANLYFWSILSEEAGFQFEVDKGTKATSVTRLEILMRECNAIVGIFTLPGSAARPNREELIKESAYFRLETDLAIRSGKPTLLYIDKRYSSVVFPPLHSPHVQYFDAYEIESGVISPSHERFKDKCQQFCREAVAYKAREFSKRELELNKVLIVVSANTPNSVYTDEVTRRIKSLLHAHGIDADIMRFPDAEAGFQLSRLDAASWVIADVGPELFRTGLVGYMHGRFIPMMRLFHASDGTATMIGEHRCLHVGIEKGYDSDLVRWRNVDDLEAGIKDRLELINAERTFIPNAEEAQRYFGKASLRKEAVFLSYSGEDQHVATQITLALKARFQDVFNYKDGESIRPGRPWLEEIDLHLRRAAIGVQLLSSKYVASSHCQEEARIMNALFNENKIKLLPVRVTDEKFDVPTWLADKQYVRLDRSGVATIVDRIVGMLENAA